MKLEDLVKEEKDRINFYGIILDCSAPYYSPLIEKYLCTIKLIDETINPSKTKRESQFLTVTVFSKTVTKLPAPAKVGSIIRVHRGQTKDNKGTIQINCDVNIKSAWVFFDPTDSMVAISSSSKTHTFVQKDKDILKALRAFGKKFFAEHELSGVTLQEAVKKKPVDFDTLCFVLEVKDKKDSTRIRLCDSHNVAKLYLATSRPLTFAPSDVVRLRSANFKEGSKNKIVFKEYSNILKVPQEYKSAKMLLDSFKKNASEDIKEQVELYAHSLSDPLVVSKISNQYKGAKIIKLKDLIPGELSKGKGKANFRLNVNVIEIGPKDPKEWLLIHDKKTQKK